jgi:hypothetical protein
VARELSEKKILYFIFWFLLVETIALKSAKMWIEQGEGLEGQTWNEY